MFSTSIEVGSAASFDTGDSGIRQREGCYRQTRRGCRCRNTTKSLESGVFFGRKDLELQAQSYTTVVISLIAESKRSYWIEQSKRFVDKLPLYTFFFALKGWWFVYVSAGRVL